MEKTYLIDKEEKIVGELLFHVIVGDEVRIANLIYDVNTIRYEADDSGNFSRFAKLSYPAEVF